MKATRKLYELGQSLWLDNITRGLLVSGTLHRYIQEFSVTGLTSNPTIFDHAIKNSQDYDDAIRQKVKNGKSGEALFFELAIEDLKEAADLFRPIHERTNGVDGWVSLEVSPLLAHDTSGTLAAAKALHARAERPNLFIKIPGTKGDCLRSKKRSSRAFRWRKRNATFLRTWKGAVKPYESWISTPSASLAGRRRISPHRRDIRKHLVFQ